MAFFGVTVETIGLVSPIEGADRIELAQLAGMDFQFVVAKGQFQPGDKCLYFPEDSLLPDETAAKLGVLGKLAGKQKNRIKTVRLRGQISQGIVGPLSLVPECSSLLPEDLTVLFGVTKYEPPETLEKGARLLPLPAGVPFYDIEGAERYPAIVEMLMDQPVMITEKVEGSNFSVLVTPDGTVSVNSHRKSIIPIEGVEHTWWSAARSSGIIDFAQRLLEKYSGGSSVVVYGEVLGPSLQGNIYNLSRHKVLVFDIRMSGAWLAYKDFLSLMREPDAPEPVPILSVDTTLREWLGGRTVKEASNGQSALYPTLREGIVVKPAREQEIPNFGRLFIKQRSPEYLAKH